MNETGNILYQKSKSICITCLKITNQLYPMSFEIKNEYNNFVGVNDPEIMICRLCRWQFQKILKFKQQCISAWTLFNEADSMNLKTHQKLTITYNLETTKTEVHYFTGNHTSYGTWSRKNLVKSSRNNLQVNGSLGDNSKVNGSLMNTKANNSQENGSPGNNFEVNGSLGNNFEVNGWENHDDGMFDEFNNEDEMPLVLLKDKNKIKKKRKRTVTLTDSVSESVQDPHLSSDKVKKQIKEGFTSRMVQETDEYVVIKLTKEQVLEEMMERSKTEAYIQSPFKCEKCVKGFNFQDVLRTHMEKHTKEIGSFQCDMCSQYCRSAVSLRGHIKSHTTRYKCKLCGVVRLSRQHLLEHHSINHTRHAAVYTCDNCRFNTNKRTVMQRHVKSHAKSEPHACEHCGKLFKSIDSLRVHTMRHDKSSRLKCHCGVSFVYHSLLRRHVSSVHERREYYCVECDAEFKSNESLRLHFKKAKKHRDSSTYKHACPQCPARCFTAAALSAHLSSAHGAARAHACPHCRRLYSSRDALRAHAHRAHCQSELTTLRYSGKT